MSALATRTSALSFFHGTSSRAAASLLRDGARNVFDDLDAWKAAEAVWKAILTRAGTFGRAANLFHDAGSAYSGSAPIALENAANRTRHGLMAHGPFYSTLNFSNACAYASRSNSGSELLLMISEGLKVLDHLGDAAAGIVRSQHPSLIEMLSQEKQPVVVEIGGISEERILREDGNPEIWSQIQFYREFSTDPSMNIPAAFRILSVVPDDVVAIYDVHWNASDIGSPLWRPDLAAA